MDRPGIEPGAFCMQSRCDTTTPSTLSDILPNKLTLISPDECSI